MTDATQTTSTNNNNSANNEEEERRQRRMQRILQGGKKRTDFIMGRTNSANLTEDEKIKGTLLIIFNWN